MPSAQCLCLQGNSAGLCKFCRSVCEYADFLINRIPCSARSDWLRIRLEIVKASEAFRSRVWLSYFGRNGLECKPNIEVLHDIRVRFSARLLKFSSAGSTVLYTVLHCTVFIITQLLFQVGCLQDWRRKDRETIVKESLTQYLPYSFSVSSIRTTFIPLADSRGCEIECTSRIVVPLNLSMTSKEISTPFHTGFLNITHLDDWVYATFALQLCTSQTKIVCVVVLNLLVHALRAYWIWRRNRVRSINLI